MDEAGSRIGLTKPKFPEAIQELIDRLLELQREKRAAVRAEDYPRAEELKAQVPFLFYFKFYPLRLPTQGQSFMNKNKVIYSCVVSQMY